VGHQNIVLTMQFYPVKDSLRLITAGEDLCIRVWDLVINKEVVCLRGFMGRITSLAFSNDHKTLIVGAKDGRISFYNAADNYRQIAVMDVVKDMNIPNPLSDQDLEVNALCYITTTKQGLFLAVGTNAGQLALVDLRTQKVCFLEAEFIASEIVHIFYDESEQNLFTYELKLKKSGVKLNKVASKCLFLDELIDIKFMKQLNSDGHASESKYAIMCSNSETLKLYNMMTGDVELYHGHDDIILCIDTHARPGEPTLVLTGAKDNTVRLWTFDPERKFQHRLSCLAVFKGHTENISGVCFAPKKREFFASVG
jgi:WD40 repeat protein